MPEYDTIAQRLADVRDAMQGLVRLGSLLALEHPEDLAYQLVCVLKPLASALTEVSIDLQDLWVLDGHYGQTTEDDL